jgi:hypothetical protein
MMPKATGLFLVSFLISFCFAATIESPLTDSDEEDFVPETNLYDDLNELECPEYQYPIRIPASPRERYIKDFSNEMAPKDPYF